jgi:hypothetical protein
MILREIFGDPKEIDYRVPQILEALKRFGFVAGQSSLNRWTSNQTTVFSKSEHKVTYVYNTSSKTISDLIYNGPLGKNITFRDGSGKFYYPDVKKFVEFLGTIKESKLNERLFGLLEDRMVLSEREADEFCEKHGKENSKHLLRFIGLLTNTPAKPISSRALYAKVMELANLFNIKVVRGNGLFDGDKAQWDGNVLKIDKALLWGFIENPRELLHEICHWQAAPMPFRMQPDYALGAVVRADKEIDKLRDARPAQNRAMDESIAIFLSACWLTKWNQKIDSEELLFPSQPVDSIIDTMIAAGLIDQDYEPRAVARISENKKNKIDAR